MNDEDGTGEDEEAKERFWAKKKLMIFLLLFFVISRFSTVFFHLFF